MALVPLVSREGKALPPHVGFDLASEFVWYTAAGSPHGTGGGHRKSAAGSRGDKGEHEGKTSTAFVMFNFAAKLTDPVPLKELSGPACNNKILEYKTRSTAV